MFHEYDYGVSPSPYLQKEKTGKELEQLLENISFDFYGLTVESLSWRSGTRRIPRRQLR